MTSQCIVAYMFSKYPSNDQKEFRKTCEASRETMRNRKDCDQALATHVTGEDKEMYVTKSST